MKGMLVVTGDSKSQDTRDCAFLSFCPRPAANLDFEGAGDTHPVPQHTCASPDLVGPADAD